MLTVQGRVNEGDLSMSDKPWDEQSVDEKLETLSGEVGAVRATLSTIGRDSQMCVANFREVTYAASHRNNQNPALCLRRRFQSGMFAGWISRREFKSQADAVG
jgi:hypothetical protein